MEAALLYPEGNRTARAASRGNMVVGSRVVAHAHLYTSGTEGNHGIVSPITVMGAEDPVG